MSEEDDAWSLGRMADHPSLVECSSARVTIDGITHRAVGEFPGSFVGWRTLCGIRLVAFANSRFAVVGRVLEGFDPSVTDVDCLCCIPAGG